MVVVFCLTVECPYATVEKLLCYEQLELLKMVESNFGVVLITRLDPSPFFCDSMINNCL